MCPLLYLIYQVRIFSMQITNFLTNLEVKIVLNHARESFHANQISTKIAFTEAKLSANYPITCQTSLMWSVHAVVLALLVI